MNPTNQAPMGQPQHKTSTLTIIILLIIAVIVAVLGFGRINSLKEESARMNKQMSSQQQAAESRKKAEQARRTQDANILKDLNEISAESSTQEKAQIDSAF